MWIYGPLLRVRKIRKAKMKINSTSRDDKRVSYYVFKTFIDLSSVEKGRPDFVVFAGCLVPYFHVKYERGRGELDCLLQTVAKHS